jgi:hypothetical protein
LARGWEDRCQEEEKDRWKGGGRVGVQRRRDTERWGWLFRLLLQPVREALMCSGMAESLSSAQEHICQLEICIQKCEYIPRFLLMLGSSQVSSNITSNYLRVGSGTDNGSLVFFLQSHSPRIRQSISEHFPASVALTSPSLRHQPRIQDERQR